MQKTKRSLLSLLLSLALLVGLGAGFVPAPAAQAEEGDFNELNQQEIVEAMGAGWNLGNQLEANTGGMPDEKAWTNVEVSESLIRAVKTSGFKSIRIPVSWLGKIGSGPDYTLNKAWLDRVQEVVDMAVKYNLYVIMNIHGDGYSTVAGGWILPEKSGQEEIKAKFGAVWGQLAERFRDYDEHMIFESMNEIGAEIKGDNAIKAAYKNINDYNQIFVDTVRKTGGNNARRWLLVPGFNTNIDYTAGDYGFQVPEDTNRSADIPAGEKRIMISVHYYTPWEFCGQEDYNQTQWGSDADPDKSVGYGSESDMEAQFAMMKTKFVDNGYPVVIGEYGSIDKSVKENSGKSKAGNPDPQNTSFRAYYAWKLCTEAKRNGCVPVYWDNGWSGDFGFALFSRGTQQDRDSGYKRIGTVIQPEIVSAIVGCFGVEKGDATAIALDKNMVSLDLNSKGEQLTASLTPADAADTITWQSSDPGVADVSYKGVIKPKGLGTCLVTATVPQGVTAYCIVKVTEPKSFLAGLYGNGGSWNDFEGTDYLEIKQGESEGNYTFTLTASKIQFQPLRTLYIKDVTVERGIATKSNLSSAALTINSAKFNDYEIELDQYKYTHSGDAFDICLVNAWTSTAHHFKGMKYSASDQGYYFPDEAYVDGKNKITLNVTVSDAVLNLKEDAPETKVESIRYEKEKMWVETGQSVSAPAVVTPVDATEKVLWYSENPKVASADQNGMITGVKGGETVVHALTASGIDEKINVTVSADPEATEEPTLPPEPTDDPVESLEPGENETAAPEETAAPGGNETNAPSGSATETPGGETAAPEGTTPPDGSQTAAPEGTTPPDGSQTAAPSATTPPDGGQTAAPEGTTPPESSDKPDTVGKDSGKSKTKKITVKKVTLKKVSSKKKRTITVQWKAVSGVTGYQIVAGTNKKVTKGKKSVTVKKAKTVKATVGKLKSKKKYFVKVRAYKVADGKKHYGSWSKVKGAKVK